MNGNGSKYIIKLYNRFGIFIDTIEPKKIKNKIFFYENINSGQGELILLVNKSIDLNFQNNIFMCKVFIVDNKNLNGKLIYTGILDKRINRKNLIEEVELFFVGISSLLSNEFYFNYGLTGIELEFDKSDTSGNIINDMISKINNYKKVLIDSIVGIFLEGETFTITGEGITGQILKIYGSDYYLSTNSGLVSGFQIVGSTSGAIGDLNIQEDPSFLNLLKVGTIATGENVNLKVGYNYFLDILNNIKESNPNLFYFIDENGNLDFRTTGYQNIILDFSKKNINLVDNEDFEICNRVYVKYNGGVELYQDITSIQTYGVREEVVDKSSEILDSDTALLFGENYVNEKKEKKGEIMIEIRQNFENFDTLVKWGDLNNTWGDYNNTWGEFGDITDIFNIKIGMFVNIRNVDYDKKYSNLVCVRKEYGDNWMRLYLNKFNNYTKRIKK